LRLKLPSPQASSLPSFVRLGDDGTVKPSLNKDVVTVTDPASGRRLVASILTVGDDVVVVVGGGDQPHVGCVVLAIPSPGRGATGFTPTCSVLTIPPHKEEPIARSVAEAVCGRLGRLTVVTAGVHEDGLDRDGIEIYLRLGEQLADAVVAHLAGSS